MSSLNTLSSSTPVHLVFEQNGKRSWFNRTDRTYDKKTGAWVTIPVIGTEPQESNSMTLEMAVICQRRWRELGIECRIAKETNGTYIDEGTVSPSSALWEFRDYLVTCTPEGEPLDGLDAPYCLMVRAVNTPNGRQFCLRALNPSLRQPSVFSSFEEGPEHCVAKAWDLGYRGYPVVANPEIERRRVDAEIKAQRAANARFANIRPGDR